MALRSHVYIGAFPASRQHRSEQAARVQRSETRGSLSIVPGLRFAPSGLRARYSQAEEKALAEAIAAAKKDALTAIAKEDFAAAMSAMASLRPKVDAFFDKVTVNVDDKALRENRLKLLNEIRAATRAVADFSKIEG